MAKASLSRLNDLHKIITGYYIEAVESGEELSSGTLAAINSHLKTNNITVDVVEDSPTKSLANNLKLLIMDKEKEA